MPDATYPKLLRLLEPPQPAEVRRAAVLVLGELGNKDAELARALTQALDDPDPELRIQALTAIGKLRIESALPRLVEKAQGAGAEADAAAQAAARLGSKGIKALQGLMTGSLPNLRRRLATALAGAGSSRAEEAAVAALLDPDPGVVDAAVRTLSAEVPQLPAAQRRALADHLLELLGKGKGPRPAPASESAVVRLLAALGDARAEAVFWERAEAPHPAEVRAAALQALGTLPPPSDRKQLQRLLSCAADPDFRVAAPALLLLRAVPVADRTWKDWLPLLDAPDPAVRRFGMDKLAGRDAPELADALLRQLPHPDRSLREYALAALGRLRAGKEALVQALGEAATPDEAWALARAQTALVRDYPAALRTQLFKQACDYLETGDRRADAILMLLREANAAEVRDRLAERAVALRKKKNYSAALSYLRLLGRDPACGEEIRFELAACGLKESTHDLAAEARAADPSLQQFARLIHSHETDPLEYLKKAKWLEPEDLFYLGFHFVEGKGAEREFGAAVLRLMVQRSPKSKLAKDARSKLRNQGLA
jgi:HEAT repeat protein